MYREGGEGELYENILARYLRLVPQKIYKATIIPVDFPALAPKMRLFRFFKIERDR